MHRKTAKRWGALCGVTGCVFGVLILLRQIAPAEFLRDPDGFLATWTARGGWPAVAVYVTVFAILGGLGVPPAIFVAALGLLWPWPVAIALALCGGMGASLLGFLIGRLVGQRMRVPERLQPYEKRMEQHGFGTVFVLRLLFFLFPPVNWLLGCTHIPVSVFAFATLLGSLPGIALLVFTGHSLFPWLLRQPPPVLAAIAAAVIGLTAIWLRSTCKHHQKPRSRDDNS